MTATENHGGKREGAGRPRGSLNRRSLEAIQAVAEKYPDWTPLQHMAAVANDETLDVEIRLDAAKSAAPYVHAKLKAVVADPDSLIELEFRIARARLEAQAKTLDENPCLADRLARALARNAEETALLAASRPVVVNVEPEPPAPEPVITARAPAAPEPASPPPAPAGADWTYSPIIPATQAFADMDYENAPGGFLSSYRNTGDYDDG
ncbi:MAG: hypothetical protein KJZ80_16100 [Hyphomicrobiaceae bacterium]|nr:hypothetical protein [Hyphomicrobiaceae bacterium]